MALVARRPRSVLVLSFARSASAAFNCCCRLSVSTVKNSSTRLLVCALMWLWM
jgi:hypothetical protein